MKSSLKKIFTLLACLLLFLCLMPADRADAAQTVASGTCGTNATWTCDTNGTLTISGTGAMKDYTMQGTQTDPRPYVGPFNYYGTDVYVAEIVIKNGITSIGDNAFSGFMKVKSVSIGNTVQSIGERAFAINAITDITIPESVSNIGTGAFESCSLLKRVFYYGKGTIGDNAFKDCLNLESINLNGTGVNKIGYCSFCNCYSLRGPLYLHDTSINTIDANAFANCTGITRITLPSTLRTLGAYAFFDCRSLSDIFYCDTESQWSSIMPPLGIDRSENVNIHKVHFNASAICTITYNDNGGTGGPEKQTKRLWENLSLVRPTKSSVGEEYTVNLNTKGGSVSPTSLTANKITRYTFESWNTRSDSSGTNYYSGGSYLSNTSLTLYAKWSSSTTTESISLPTPVREGYIFKGWGTTDRADTGITGNYTPAENVTLYAIWDPVLYSITYDANGGIGVPDSQTKTHGITMTLSSIKPTRSESPAGSFIVAFDANGGDVNIHSLNSEATTSYIFRSWNTRADGTGTNYAPGTSFTSNENVTLYAQWESNTIGEPVALPTPTRSGFAFMGWGISSDATSGVSGMYAPIGNIKLYALWADWDTVTKYSITYTATQYNPNNSPYNIPGNQVKIKGVAHTLSTQVPLLNAVAVLDHDFKVTFDAKGGQCIYSNVKVRPLLTYTFRNWNTSENGKGRSYEPGEFYTDDYNVILYAQWKLEYLATMTLPTPTRTDYVFKGWSTSKDATSGVTGEYTFDRDTTLYATWEESSQYSVFYDANGGTGAPSSQTEDKGESLTLSSDKPTHQNTFSSYSVTLNSNGGDVSPSSLTAERTTTYAFKDWNTKPDGTGTSYASGATYIATASATLYAQWNSSTSTAAVTLPTPTRSGYTFVGWGTSSTATTGVTGDYTPTDNVILYAVWLPEYTIAYNANGGSGAPASQAKTQGKTIQLSSANPTRVSDSAGNYTVTLDPKGGIAETNTLNASRITVFTFTNWNTKADGSGTTYDSAANYSQDADLLLYAQWSSTVQTLPVTLPTPTRAGYDFIGWSASETEVSVLGNRYTPLDDTTLFAIWEPCKVIFDANGGSAAPESQIKEYGQDLILTSQRPVHASMDSYYTVQFNANGGSVSPSSLRASYTIYYTFTGWNTKPDGSGTAYPAGSTYSAESSMTLYAQWKSTSSKASSITLPTPTRSGYDFLGWDYYPSDYFLSGIFGSFMPDSNVTLYANWGKPVSSGKISSSAYWKKYSNNRLVISGTGAMPDYNNDYDPDNTGKHGWVTTAPWGYEIEVLAIQDGITTIGKNAFCGCSRLTMVKIPSSVISVGDYAFEFCTDLSSIVIPSSVTSLGESVLHGCTSLTRLTVPSSVATIGQYAFSECTSLKSIVISSGVTRMEYGLFAGCTDLTELAIPSSVTQIGNNAFLNCTSLANVSIPENLTIIGSNSFQNCVSLTNITIPDSVTSIGSGAFKDCNSLTGINIPASVKKIGAGAFSGCTGLTNTSITDIGAWCKITFADASANPLLCSKSLYLNDLPVTELVIPDSVTAISAYAFYKCTDLTAVTIPSSVTEIGESAFRNCSSISSIEGGNAIASIGSYAFCDCNSLTELTLSTSITSIGSAAFFGCTGLTDIYYTGTETLWNEVSIGTNNSSLSQAAMHYKAYTVSYDPNGGVGAPASKTTDKGSITLSYLKPSRADTREDSFTVVLNPNGGSVSPDLLEAERTASYSFKNWNTSADGSGTAYASGASYTENESVILYAQWNVSVSTASVTLPIPTREGYVFKGWGTSSNAISTVTGTYTPSDNVTLYAVWKALYSLNYDANGGIDVPESITEEQGTVLTISDYEPERVSDRVDPYTVTLDTNGGVVSETSLDAERIKNYTFRTWNTQMDGSGTSYIPGASYTLNSNVTLYAQWKSNTITAAVTLPQPTREGYVFRGWSESSSAATGRTGDYIPTKNIVLHAVWSAVKEEGDWGGLHWMLSKDRTLMITGAGPMDHFEDENTTLAWHAYSDQIVSIVVQNGITTIGDCAFARLTSLTSVSLPESVSSFGWGVFVYCNSLTDLTIPEGVTHIGSYSFYECSSLRNVVLPEGITSIDYNMFYNCTQLSSVTIPRNITAIDSDAFRGCTGLKDIYYENGQEMWAALSVSSAEIIAATIHYSSTSSGVWGDNISWTLDGDSGRLTISGNGAMGDSNAIKQSKRTWLSCKNRMKEVIIEEGVTSICGFAFEGCSGINHLVIPESISLVRSAAFKDCKLLKSLGAIESGSNVEIGWQETIPPHAFDQLTSLTRAVIPEGITEIGSRAFYGCSALKFVKIPESVRKLGEGVFAGCESLSAITVPDGADSLGKDLFSGCSGLTSISLPKLVDDIGSGMFTNCRSLTSIVIPEGMAKIGRMDFTGCDSLTDMTVPSSVTEIEAYALYTIPLKHLYYNGTREAWDQITVGDQNSAILKATIHCSDLTYGAWGYANADPHLYWNLDANGVLTISGEGLILDFSSGDNTTAWHAENASVKEVLITNGITEVGEYAFQGFSNLQRVAVAEGVSKISSRAFSGCSNLNAILLPDSLISMGTYVFSGCGNLKNIELPTGITGLNEGVFWYAGLSLIELPTNMKILGYNTFKGCAKMTKIFIPATVTQIGENAFNGCTALKDVYYEGTEDQWNSLKNKIMTSGNSLLLNATIHCNSRMEYGINYNSNGGTGAPEGQSKVKNESLMLSEKRPEKTGFTFLGWSTIADATAPEYQPGGRFEINADTALYAVWLAPDFVLPAYLKTIEEEAFTGGAFIYVTLPEGTETIHARAFADCPNLMYIYIPDSVTTIDQTAFENVSNLTILGKTGSSAESYASSYGYRFIVTE